MIVQHRGYEIRVTREKCLGGWSMLYYSVMRLSDTWFALDSFEDSGHTVRELVGYMKERIDAELAEENPWMEQAEKNDPNFFTYVDDRI